MDQDLREDGETVRGPAHGKHLWRLLRVGLVVGCVYGWLGCSDALCDQRICTLDCSSPVPVLSCTRGSVTTRLLTRNPQGQPESFQLTSSLGLYTTCYNEYQHTVQSGYVCFGECHACTCTLIKRHGEMVCEQ
jgi:hypothetical protein